MICGVCGYLADEQARPSVESIVDRFLSIESRGSDASGFSASIDGKLWRLRAPVPAHVLAGYKTAKTLLVDQTNAWIGHTRLATRGLASNNENNHPFIGSGLALVHNGIICDYDEQAERLNGQLKGQCDSEIILRLIQRDVDRGGSITSAIKKMARKLDGDMACALINRSGSHLWVWRREWGDRGGYTPLWLALQPGVQAVHFASTSYCLDRSLLNNRAWDITSLPNLSGVHFWIKGGRLQSQKFTLDSSRQNVWNDGWNSMWDPVGSRYIKKDRPKAKRIYGSEVLPLGIRFDALYVCDECEDWFLPEEVFDHKMDAKHYVFREEM